jgi:hypothetical protein
MPCEKSRVRLLLFLHDVQDPGWYSSKVLYPVKGVDRDIRHSDLINGGICRQATECVYMPLGKHASLGAGVEKVCR